MLPLFALLALFALTSAEEAGGIPLGNGNIGITGGGYGDVYGGKVKDGVYGAGGRVGGQLGLTGLLGLGGIGGRRKRQDFGFVPFASLNIAPPVEPAATAAAPKGGRRKREILFPITSAIAAVEGAKAVAGAAAGAGPYRFVPFESLFPHFVFPTTTVAPTSTTPAATTAAPVATTTEESC